MVIKERAESGAEWSSDGTGIKRESTLSGGHSSLGGGDVVDHPTTGTLNT